MSLHECKIMSKTILKQREFQNHKFVDYQACKHELALKGGIGMPAVVSVCFFLIFHVLTITGEKSAKEGVWEAWQGAWLASFVLLPIGIFLTYKATRDSALFDFEAYLTPIKKIFSKKHESTTNL